MYIINIEEGLNNLMKPVQNFMQEHGDNPLVWFAIFGIGALVFFGLIHHYKRRNKNER